MAPRVASLLFDAREPMTLGAEMSSFPCPYVRVGPWSHPAAGLVMQEAVASLTKRAHELEQKGRA